MTVVFVKAAGHQKIYMADELKGYITLGRNKELPFRVRLLPTAITEAQERDFESVEAAKGWVGWYFDNHYEEVVNVSAS